jgi:hypothetical protein
MTQTSNRFFDEVAMARTFAAPRFPPCHTEHHGLPSQIWVTLWVT